MTPGRRERPSRPEGRRWDRRQRQNCRLARNGLKGRSAFIAGVVPKTVNAHIKNDPDFEEAADIALCLGHPGRPGPPAQEELEDEAGRYLELLDLR